MTDPFSHVERPFDGRGTPEPDTRPGPRQCSLLIWRYLRAGDTRHPAIAPPAASPAR